MAPASRDADALSRVQKIACAIELLKRALEFVDKLDDCTSTGARIQGIIDELRTKSTNSPADRSKSARVPDRLEPEVYLPPRKSS